MRLPKPPPGLKPLLPLVIGAVVVALLAGVVIGRLLPASAGAPVETQAESSASADGGHTHGGGSTEESEPADLEGLSLSASGFTLVPKDTELDRSNEAKPWAFTITDVEGEPITKFATLHDKKMHLFAVRRDFTGYQHLHPVMDPDTGLWSTDITFDTPGGWRVIADFAVGGGKDVTTATLGTDVTVPGDYEPAALPEPKTTAKTDGFDVTLDFKPELGASAPALIEVTEDGKAADLERYLGAHGHLVLLRQDDMGFAHVHPDSKRVDGKLRFWATVPSKGDYRAFLDFKVDGKVRTAAFTITV